MVSSPPMHISKEFKAKVFSLKNVDEFFGWLDDLEAGMTSEQKNGVFAAYGSV